MRMENSIDNNKQALNSRGFYSCDWVGCKRTQAKLLEFIKSSAGQTTAEIVASGASVVNPLFGVLISAAKDIAGLADEIRINALIKGLSTELNQEQQINLLYRYIQSSEEHAFYVSNSLRKALLSNSPIACAIMGRMLARHIASNTSYDQDDKIIFQALENATDDDVQMFYDFMNEYNSIADKPKTIPFELLNKYSVIENWCEFNRIVRHNMSVDNYGEEVVFNENFSLYSAALRLMDYIESIRQLLDYGKPRF